MTQWPVVREVRRLPSGRVEYTLVDQHGNVRRLRALDNVGAFVDTTDLLANTIKRGMRPKGVPRWRDD